MLKKLLLSFTLLFPAVSFSAPGEVAASLYAFMINTSTGGVKSCELIVPATYSTSNAQNVATANSGAGSVIGGWIKIATNIKSQTWANSPSQIFPLSGNADRSSGIGSVQLTVNGTRYTYTLQCDTVQNTGARRYVAATLNGFAGGPAYPFSHCMSVVDNNAIVNEIATLIAGAGTILGSTNRPTNLPINSILANYAFQVNTSAGARWIFCNK